MPRPTSSESRIPVFTPTNEWYAYIKGSPWRCPERLPYDEVDEQWIAQAQASTMPHHWLLSRGVQLCPKCGEMRVYEEVAVQMEAEVEEEEDVSLERLLAMIREGKI